MGGFQEAAKFARGDQRDVLAAASTNDHGLTAADDFVAERSERGACLGIRGGWSWHLEGSLDMYRKTVLYARIGNSAITRSTYSGHWRSPAMLLRLSLLVRADEVIQ